MQYDDSELFNMCQKASQHTLDNMKAKIEVGKLKINRRNFDDCDMIFVHSLLLPVYLILLI